MDAVTYPDPQVTALLSERFSCVKINMLDRHPDFKEASAPGKVMWAPTLVFRDSRDREIRRFVGWLPPESFLSELELVLGLDRVHHAQFADAATHFGRVVEDLGDNENVAEGLYWRGISEFLAGGKDFEALRRSWGALHERFPGTRWATHASVIEDAPA